MPFPNLKGKHLKEPLFTPDDFVKTVGSKKAGLNKFIIIYSQKALDYFIDKYSPKKIHIYKLVRIYSYKNIGVVKITGIGSPNASTVLEELISLGGREFFNIGHAGGLENFGLFVCTKAIRDEGTSYHYLAHSKYAYPDSNFTKEFCRYLTSRKIDFTLGATWTIDAPYMETRDEIKKYKSEGVKTVEMEASALFAVAKIRNVKIASAFIASDLVGGTKWNPQFNNKKIRTDLNMLMDYAIDFLNKK